MRWFIGKSRFWQSQWTYAKLNCCNLFLLSFLFPFLVRASKLRRRQKSHFAYSNSYFFWISLGFTLFFGYDFLKFLAIHTCRSGRSAKLHSLSYLLLGFTLAMFCFTRLISEVVFLLFLSFCHPRFFSWQI